MNRTSKRQNGSSKHRHNRRCGHSRRRHMRGGASYTSATTYGGYVNGPVSEQYARVFNQGGAYGNIPGNALIGAQGQNAHLVGQPNASQLALIQSGGKRRGQSKGKRGGFVGVLEQAAVPFGLVALNHMYKNRGVKHSSSRHRRSQRHH